MQTVHGRGSRSGATPPISENGKGFEGCPSKHAIRRRGFVFLSHALLLGCLHEDCYGTIAERPPQLHHVIP